MIYKYNVSIPLMYNRFDINSTIPDSEARYELDEVAKSNINVVFQTYEIPGLSEGVDFEDKVEVILRSTHGETPDNQGRAASFSNLVDPYITCEIKGVLVDHEKYAKQYVEKIVNKICRELSFVFVSHNANRHLYQPRVEPNWSRTKWDYDEYQPFIEVRNNALNKKDHDNVMHLMDSIHIHDSCYMMSTIGIPVDEMKIWEWIFQKNEVVEFLMNEYYVALGLENVKSKFFHLYAMIEFCEKEYENHNGAQPLLSEDEVDDLVKDIKEKLDPDKREKVVSSIKNNLLKINDTGRIQKLINILSWMGIKDYKQFGADKTIDKKVIEDIIKLRNKSFHGTKEDEQTRQQDDNKYSDAVVKLMYINEQIINFVKKQSKVEYKSDGVVVIHGKQ